MVTAHALNRAALPIMLEGGGGSIVGISSIPAGDYLTGKVLGVDGGLDQPNLGLGLPDL